MAKPPPKIDPVVPEIAEQLRHELTCLWAAHKAVGLDGYMCLFSLDVQDPWRAKEEGIKFWFGPDQVEEAIEEFFSVYNRGQLPNTTLLLNPIVHEKKDDGTYKPLGSGFMWCTSFALGVGKLEQETLDRFEGINVLSKHFHRGESKKAGLKSVAFSNRKLEVHEDGVTVEGCNELYELAALECPQYHKFYPLSGVGYLSTHGLFVHPDFAEFFEEGALADPKKYPELVKSHQIDVQIVKNAAFCWNSYDRYHSLYEKFGIDPKDVPQNLRFFNLVSRDIMLFDRTGPMRKDIDQTFEFIVPGWVPRGCVTLLAATGGTGKSSLAHYLSVIASIDYTPDEEQPRWLGEPLNVEKCMEGICVYFSGEDGAPIINARAKLFDPERRAKRLMFNRTDFGEGVTFPQYMRYLHKIPRVPVMVIDPARKYLLGDENDAGVVSEFFEAIEEYAIEKDCAMVVVHHLQKNAYPKSAHEVLDLLRGSQVFIDRPRVVIGMFRDGPYTIAGLAKNNIPPNLGMVQGERVFARNPKNLSLIQLPGKEGERPDALSEEELERLEQEAEQARRAADKLKEKEAKAAK